MRQKTLKVYGDEAIRDGIYIEGIKAGDEFILVEFENLMTGDRWYELRPDNGMGVPGNLWPVVYCYHGWRGTTNNIHKAAHGLRKVMKVSEIQFSEDRNDYYVKVTVGRDLHPEWD